MAMIPSAETLPDTPAEHMTIYALSDPRDGKTYYVGMSSNLKTRMNTHLSTQNGASIAVHTWIHALRLDGGTPQMTFIDHVPATGAALYESAIIQEFRERGEPLLNHYPPGPDTYGYPQAQCQVCQHRWYPRIVDPRVCPKCHRRYPSPPIYYPTLEEYHFSRRQVRIIANALALHVRKRVVYAHLYEHDPKKSGRGTNGADLMNRIVEETGVSPTIATELLTQYWKDEVTPQIRQQYSEDLKQWHAEHPEHKDTMRAWHANRKADTNPPTQGDTP